MTMRITLSLLTAGALAALTSCGGSSNGGPQAALSLGTADWIVLDLETRGITYRGDVPGANSDPDYCETKMAFRRVRSSGGDFFVAMYEITQAQWTLLADGTTATVDHAPWLSVDDKICSVAAHAGHRPAYNLNHIDTAAALTLFTLPSGARLDLPTSEEWTAACGTTTGWWWGATATAEEVMTNAVARESVMTVPRLIAGGGMDTGGPLNVGVKTANRWGLHDVLGNVWEWTREGTEVRGGSWYDGIQSCRAEVKAVATDGILTTINYALVGARPVLRP